MVHILGEGVSGPVIEENGMAVKTILLDREDIEHMYDLSNYKKIVFPPPRNCEIPDPRYFRDDQPFLPGVNPWRELAILKECIDVEGVVRIIDYDVCSVWEDGREGGYLVIRTKVAGRRTLSDWLESDEYNIVDLKKIMDSICRSLVSLSMIGVVHMDLKPRNIVLDEVLNPTIVDFGWSMMKTFPMCEQEEKYFQNSLMSDYDNLMKFIKYKYKKNI